MFPKRIYYHYKGEYFEAHKDGNGVVVLDRTRNKYFYLKEVSPKLDIDWERVEYRSLYTIVFVMIGIVISSILLTNYLAYQTDFSYLTFRYAPTFIFYFALYSIVQVILHEMSHILSLRISGYKHDKFGFTLDYNILPSFYVRVNKVQLLTVDKKLIVHLSGVFANSIVNFIAVGICLVVKPPLFVSSIFIIYSFGILINSLPFINSDGFKSMLVFLDIKEFKYSKSTIVTVTKYVSIFCMLLYVLFVVSISIIRYV